MVLGIATGCLYRMDLSLTQEIAHIRSMDVDGIEITFSDTDELMGTSVDDLAGLDDAFSYVSFHSPIELSLADHPEPVWILEHLERLREAAGARCVVFHPPEVPSLELLEEHTRPAIENMQRRKGFDRDRFAEFIRHDTPVVLDSCHSATWSDDEFGDLLDGYADQVQHVHLSAYGDSSHELVVDNPGFMHTLPSLDDHRVIIENKARSVEALRREVEHVRDHASRARPM